MIFLKLTFWFSYFCKAIRQDLMKSRGLSLGDFYFLQKHKLCMSSPTPPRPHCLHLPSLVQVGGQHQALTCPPRGRHEGAQDSSPSSLCCVFLGSPLMIHGAPCNCLLPSPPLILPWSTCSIFPRCPNHMLIFSLIDCADDGAVSVNQYYNFWEWFGKILRELRFKKKLLPLWNLGTPSHHVSIPTSPTSTERDFHGVLENRH